MANFLSSLLSLLRRLIGGGDASASPVSPPVEPAAPPEQKKYPLSPEVRAVLLAGHTLSDRVEIEQQIEQHEITGDRRYTIRYSCGFYVIDRGQIVGSGRE